MALLAISLRPATVADEGFLDELYASTRADEVAAWGWLPAQQRAFLAQQARVRRAGYAAQFPAAEDAIVEVEGRAVGRCLVDRSGPVITLVDLALVPARRGQGLGTAVLERLLAEARAQGRRVRLHVERANRAAALYRRLGFEGVEEDPFRLTMEWAP
jgi:ribosomal protein S18 acetylase RimI-like enzyme